MKVLIVEDDELIGQLIQEELEDFNISSVIARDAITAYKILNISKDFDYAVVDPGLPDENGIILGRYIKSISHIKLIIYTGSELRDYRNLCEYDYFLEKGPGIKCVTDIIVNDFLSRFS